MLDGFPNSVVVAGGGGGGGVECADDRTAPLANLQPKK